VLQDFYDYFPFVSQHGLILLHDTHPRDDFMLQRIYCDTAYQAIEELSKDTTEYELMTIPVNPGVTICRKRKKQLSWHE
ncbi:MAG: class I SAM-dependent methyltransferase, partial [Lysinibacillus sp.]